MASLRTGGRSGRRLPGPGTGPHRERGAGSITARAGLGASPREQAWGPHRASRPGSLIARAGLEASPRAGHRLTVQQEGQREPAQAGQLQVRQGQQRVAIQPAQLVHEGAPLEAGLAWVLHLEPHAAVGP